MRGKRREWGKEGDRKPGAQSGQSRKIPMHRGRGDGADRPTLPSTEEWKKKPTAEAIEVSCRSVDAI